LKTAAAAGVARSQTNHQTDVTDFTDVTDVTDVADVTDVTDAYSGVAKDASPINDATSRALSKKQQL
jgi:hypothetical protein